MRRDYVKNRDGWYRVTYCGICGVPALLGPTGDYWKHRPPIERWTCCQACKGDPFLGGRKVRGTNLQVKDVYD